MGIATGKRNGKIYTYIVARYSPRGNWGDNQEFAANVMPLKGVGKKITSGCLECISGREGGGGRFLFFFIVSCGRALRTKTDMIYFCQYLFSSNDIKVPCCQSPVKSTERQLLVQQKL